MPAAPFHCESIAEGITRIELPPLSEAAGALSQAVNVYLVEGSSPALVNTGHPAHTDSLVAALRSCSITPAQIERIVTTSWRIDVLGGARHFPRADLFVLSPDMAAPRDYEMHVDARRQKWLQLADELARVDEDFRTTPVVKAIESYYPRTSRDLRFIPLRNGHFLQLGDLHLEVLATTGPGSGHMALYAGEEQLLFCGDFAMSGLPVRIDNPRGYLVSLERLAELPSQRVLPNRGRTFEQGRWTVTRAANFLNNFLSTAPSALVGAPTVAEFIERDRGTSVEDPLEMLVDVQLYRALLDELVRNGSIAAEGQGVQRRYGVDVDDPREKLRPS